jgi:hypothetical protein
MLKELLDGLTELARTSMKPVVMSLPGDGRKQLIATGDGMEIADIAPPVRSHTARSVGSLVEAVMKYKHDSASIWHNEEVIEAVLDDEDRRDRITMPLAVSDAWCALKNLPVTVTQRDLISLLKFDLGVQQEIIAKFRNVTFSRQQSSQATLKTGDESLGRSVEQAVANVKDIPDVIPLLCTIYRNPGLTCSVRVDLSVEIDIPNETFTLRPGPDALRLAMIETQRHIHEVLTEAVADQPGVTVFEGSVE